MSGADLHKQKSISIAPSPPRSASTLRFGASEARSDERGDHRRSMMLYFYTELMRCVVADYAELDCDDDLGSDENLLLDAEKATAEHSALGSLTRLAHSTRKIESMSKLRERMIATQSHMHNVAARLSGVYSGSQCSLTTVTRRKSKKVRTSHSNANTSRNSVFSGVTSGAVSGFTADSVSRDDASARHRSQSIVTVLSEEVGFFEQHNWESVRMRLVFSTGAVYCGDMVRHQFHGMGAYTWPNGISYEGEFQRGAVTGYGKLTYSDLSYYRGTFLNGVLEGTGTFCPSYNPASYTGMWSNGVPHGRGHLSYAEHDDYEGQFEAGLRHGQGTRVYANKAVYCGAWHKGAPSGEGAMLFANRDFYRGEWRDGKPHGSGAYVWDARLNEGVSYSNERAYSGSFTNGLRDGYGVQVLGMEGSKVATQFDDNMKSGVGILVCGDGTTIERKPLFMLDNPVAVHRSEMLSTVISSFNIWQRKDASSKIAVRMLRNSMMGDEAGDEGARSRIADTFPAVDANGEPLRLPVHATPKDVALTYHVGRLLALQERRKVGDASGETADATPNAALENELRLLGRAVANNYAFLRRVYHKYATLNPLQQCCPELTNPVMSRLHLWQFLRDIQACSLRVSLVDVDLMLLDVPDIHLEAEHDPFEIVYFWQFMHCLLLLALVKHTSMMVLTATDDGPPPAGAHAHAYHEIFRAFIVDHVKPHEGAFGGRALFVCKDLLPLPPVYELYQSVGEPHSARTLLNRICHRKGERPLQCNVKRRRILTPKVDKRHYVLGGSTILYMSVKREEPWEAHPAPAPDALKTLDDPFYTDLRVFRALGPAKVMECITNVCTNVVEEGDIVFVDYQISFLEFYEILINLAEELSKAKRSEELEVQERAQRDSRASDARNERRSRNISEGLSIKSASSSKRNAKRVKRAHMA